MQFKMAESVETLTLWLAVKVVSRSEVLFGSKIISCSGVETFGGLLSRLEEERFSETKEGRGNSGRGLNSGHRLLFSGEEGLHFQTWYAWTTTLA